MNRLFKDAPQINHPERCLENLELLLSAVRKEARGKSVEELTAAGWKAIADALNVPRPTGRETPHAPKHGRCEGVKTERLTEKRMCRCMFYARNGDRSRCGECPFQTWIPREGSRFDVREYEYPMEFDLPMLGGVDLVLEDRETGRFYATEVKPAGSRETLARMVAEILSYFPYMKKGEKWSSSSIFPAIAFFKGRDQWNAFFDPDINPERIWPLWDYVQVFAIDSPPAPAAPDRPYSFHPIRPRCEKRAGATEAPGLTAGGPRRAKA